MFETQAFHSMMIPIVCGMLLLTIGFNFRERKVGVLSIWFGMLLIFGTIVFKILAKLNE
ncbi:hypothetical protein ACIQYF_07895 [Pseudomonas sp. NPDC096917]|uniref:hypothetical protein n=1 Tax=Pseudomonas sp. NPDC096917 TaxID=3364483 RepID=UPI00383BF149